MAGTRAYRRDNKGRFAGSGGGSMVTYGKAGGFANAAFRSRTSSQRASPSKSLGATAGAKGRQFDRGVAKQRLQTVAFSTALSAGASASLGGRRGAARGAFRGAAAGLGSASAITRNSRGQIVVGSSASARSVVGLLSAQAVMTAAPAAQGGIMARAATQNAKRAAAAQGAMRTPTRARANRRGIYNLTTLR